MHTQYFVSAYSTTPGLVYERNFPDRESAINYADAMRKQRDVRKCVIDTMLVSDCMDRFQLTTLTKEDNSQ